MDSFISLRTPHFAAISLAAFFAFGVTPSDAGLITISDPPGVVVTPGGAASISVAPTIDYQTISPSMAKISGTAGFLSSGGSGTISVDVGGLATVLLGETISVDYDFTLSLTGGSLDWTLTGMASIVQIFNKSGSISSGSQQFIGSDSFTNTFSDFNGVPWSASLDITWNGASNGDTLTVTVPNNSIDFSVIPEPTSFCLIGIGGLALLLRRRR